MDHLGIALAVPVDLHQRVDAVLDATLGKGQLAQGQRALPHQGLEPVALGHRHVEAADLVPVPELIEPHQPGQGLVEGLGVLLERLVGVSLGLGRARHSCH